MIKQLGIFKGLFRHWILFRDKKIQFLHRVPANSGCSRRHVYTHVVAHLPAPIPMKSTVIVSFIFLQVLKIKYLFKYRPKGPAVGNS
jgi:hypothetical protein